MKESESERGRSIEEIKHKKWLHRKKENKDYMDSAVGRGVKRKVRARFGSVSINLTGSASGEREKCKENPYRLFPPVA